jgi:hypothetical protein
VGALCLLVASVVSGVFALLLLTEAVLGNHRGSPGGTILLAGFGFLLLFFSVLVFTFILMYLKS